MNETDERCQRCGTCCLKGGPALHTEDKALLMANHLGLAQLITVRRGERVIWPGVAKPAPTAVELVKLQGQEGEWRCLFYSMAANGCSIYANRPLECRILQCWAPDKLYEIAGQGTLIRTDLLHPDDPVREFIQLQEMKCPANRIEELAPQALPGSAALLELQELVRTDLIIRSQAMGRLGIAPELELFLFGRPYFILLAPFGIAAREMNDGLRLELTTLS